MMARHILCFRFIIKEISPGIESEEVTLWDVQRFFFVLKQLARYYYSDYCSYDKQDPKYLRLGTFAYCADL